MFKSIYGIDELRGKLVLKELNYAKFTFETNKLFDDGFFRFLF